LVRATRSVSMSPPCTRPHRSVSSSPTTSRSCERCCGRPSRDGASSWSGRPATATRPWPGRRHRARRGRARSGHARGRRPRPDRRAAPAPAGGPGGGPVALRRLRAAGPGRRAGRPRHPGQDVDPDRLVAAVREVCGRAFGPVALPPPDGLEGLAGDELERVWGTLAAAPVATAVVGPDGRFLRGQRRPVRPGRPPPGRRLVRVAVGGRARQSSSRPTGPTSAPPWPPSGTRCGCCRCARSCPEPPP
jgi:hypothetical protein